jgi:hypothetical protein
VIVIYNQNAALRRQRRVPQWIFLGEGIGQGSPARHVINAALFKIPRTSPNIKRSNVGGGIAALIIKHQANTGAICFVPGG